MTAPEKRDARLSKIFGRWVGRQDWRGANAIVGFVRNIDPGLCAAAKKRRVVTVVDQMIAPATMQLAEARRQEEEWPHWRNSSHIGNADVVRDIERQTWALADHITCHTFRATGITAYLENGGSLEHAQRIAAHESVRTTKLYDRTEDAVSLDEIERIAI